MNTINTVPDFRNINDPNNITDLAFHTVKPSSPEETQELERSQETISVVKDSPVITNSFDPNIDPYIDIVKVPLTTEHGGESRAHSIRIPEWNDREIGVVGETYLCVPNSQIAEVGAQIRAQSGMQWKESKVFFDGKVYRRTFTCDDGGMTAKVPVVGDLICLVMEEMNSYDSTIKAGILCYFMRLVCLNGMRSKAFSFGHTFRHSMNNIDWEEEIHQSVLKLTGREVAMKLPAFANACGALQKPIDFHDLKLISTGVLDNDGKPVKDKEYLSKLPTQQYGQIVKNMLVSENYPQNGDSYTSWDLLNSGTEILWHQRKITQGAIKNNSHVVDGLLRYGRDTLDNQNPVNPRQMSIPMDDNPAHS